MGIRERLFGTPKEPTPVKEGGIVIAQVKQDSGQSPSESFKDQVDIFNEDPDIKQTILEFAEEVVSTGIFTSHNEKYTLKLPVEGKNLSAKEVIDKWNKDNNLDEKLLQCATEIRAFGNSVYYIGDNGFQNIPLEAIMKSYATSKTTPISEKYDLMTTGTYGSKKIPYGTFMHFKINTTGYAPFGSGIIVGLMAIPSDTTNGTDVPSLYEVRKAVRASMKIGFEKFSFGNELWSMEGASKEDIEALGTKLAGMSSTGNRIATGFKGNIELAIPQRTQSYDKWIEQIDKEFYMSLGGFKDPNTEFTTKATAEALYEAHKYAIASIRRVIKRQIESLWNKILDNLGFDSEEAEVKLHFGSEEETVNMDQLMSFVDKGIVSKKEARKHLIKIAKLELEGEEPPKEDTTVQDTQLKQMDAKIERMTESMNKKNKKMELMDKIVRSVTGE